MRKRRTITAGERFGRLVVVAQVANRNGERFVQCRCDCGGTTTVRFTYLPSEHTTSCGCVRREALQLGVPALSTHRMSKTPEYRAWIAMKNRCYSPTSNGFPNYGQRGIRVCKRWRDSFEYFYADVGRRPGKGYSLDRIDNDGDYAPDNCRWATQKQQMANQRRTDLISFRGETLPLTIWARRIGMPQPKLRQRIHRLHWSVEKALTEPVRKYTRHR